MVEVRENGNQDPRGNGSANPDAYGRASYDRACPFCGAVIGNTPQTHLPCEGVEDE